MWNVLNERNDAAPYFSRAWFDSHSRAWHSLIGNTNFGDKYICHTIQYMVPYCFFFSSEKEGIEKENTIQVYFQLTLLHLLTERVPKSTWFLITFSIYDGKLSSTIASNLPILPHSHQKKRKKKKQESMNHSFSILFVRTSVQDIIAVTIVCSRYLYRVS